MAMNEEQFRKWLESKIKKAGSLRGLARELNVSPAYLSDVRTGRRFPGPKLLDPLGLRRCERVTIESAT